MNYTFYWYIDSDHYVAKSKTVLLYKKYWIILIQIENTENTEKNYKILNTQYLLNNNLAYYIYTLLFICKRKLSLIFGYTIVPNVKYQIAEVKMCEFTDICKEDTTD